MSEHTPQVVIVGGGFGGLAAAKALRRTPVDVFLIDRTNHHLFQPLLYQVATSVLTPGQIGSPIREVLRNQWNTTVILGEVTGVNKEQHYVIANSVDRVEVPIPYDYLILATGVRHSYFGHEEFEQFAPGLKSVADAVAIRNRILQAFEQAEAEEDPRRHRDLLTFVLVGAGPTGVEMAGALAVLVRTSLRSEFRRIDPLSARIVLVDRGNRVLGSFAEELSSAAKQRLERLGVEVRLGHGVDQIDEDGVIVAGERIASRTVIWTAGVAPSPAGKWLAAETDRAGRVKVQPDLSVPGHPDIFRGGRHRLTPARRKTAPRSCSSRNAAGTLCRKADSSTRLSETCTASVQLFRQREHGGGRQRVCHFANGARTDQRLYCLDGMGRGASRVSWPVQPSR
jgi:NADH dehydrogenase FAD-containing subunit